MTESPRTISHLPPAPDPSRHEEFVRQFGMNQGRVFAFLLTVLANHADAEEVLQETSIVLWRKFDEFDTGADFVRWACGIAYREAMSFLRRHRRERATLSVDVLDRIAYERLLRHDMLARRREALDRCLRKLAPHDRHIVEHYYFSGGTTVSEVARRINRPTDTIYKALIRIRTALHRCIDRTLAMEEAP